MEREGEAGDDLLTDYQPHMDWLVENKGGLFRTPGSLAWFTRQHIEELVREKAILVRRGPGGKWINKKRFPNVALRIFHRESKTNV